MSKKEIFIKDGKAYFKQARKGEEPKTVRIGHVFLRDGEAVFNYNGEETFRIITVVGIRYKEKVLKTFQTPWGLFDKPVKETILKLGITIKHPDDNEDEKLAVKIALKRALSSHKRLVSNSFSMLTSDRCIAIVENELEHIQQNIAKYLPDYEPVTVNSENYDPDL
jgi:hypothetical protein